MSNQKMVNVNNKLTKKPYPVILNNEKVVMNIYVCSDYLRLIR